MKTTMKNFIDYSLSKAEMRSVRGGGCVIAYDYQGGCGNWKVNYSGNMQSATQYANKQMAADKSHQLGGYQITCN